MNRLPLLRACLAVAALSALAAAPVTADQPAPPGGLRLRWADNWLYISGPQVPGGEISIHYLEAYCRPGSTHQDWRAKTKIPHRTELLSADENGRRIELRCEVEDGVTVRHIITAADDEVDFRLTAHNPTQQTSLVHWAQPCIRVDKFTGRGKEDYIPHLFIFLDDQLTRLPTRPWATEALYTPGQVYCPKHVSRDDVNPRPLSPLVPSNGLCGAFSSDEKTILATAWEPYQELFQGVGVCIHSDFRVGGLDPAQTKTIRGKLYIVPADVDALLARYHRDFPEHAPAASHSPRDN